MLRNLLPLIFLLFLDNGLQAQIIVTNSNIGLQLAQKLLGGGVSISNVTFIAANGSCGIFINRGSAIQIDSGIVLTSGFAETTTFPTRTGIVGVASDDADEDNGAGSDASLTALINRQTRNASILEFDFVPQGDTIKFNYVFSSEEYPDYNCSQFNDVFAFFINGPGIVGVKNMALVPNTTIPVAINTINSGVVSAQGNLTNCTSFGPGSPFTSLYVNNLTGTTFTHNGLTVKLTAKSAVIPCQVYHLKIAIADASDEAFDSGVFIEANSLNSIAATMQPLGTTDPSTNTVFLAEGCVSGGVRFSIPNPKPVATTFNLAMGGTVSNGVDATTIPTSITIPQNSFFIDLPITAFTDALNEGVEFLNIYITSPCGTGVFLDSIRLEIRDYDILALTPKDTAFYCVGGTLQLNASTGYTSYLWDANPTLNTINIANPIATPLAPTTYYCTATLGTCRARDSIFATPNRFTLQSKVDINCKNGNTGSISVVAGQGWAHPLQFSINGGASQTDSTFNSLTVGNYNVTITDNIGCTRTLVVPIVQAFPDLTFTEVVNPPSCNVATGTITVTPSGGRSPYQYSLDGINYSSNNSLVTTTSGLLSVYVRDANNCITTKSVNVIPTSTLQITNTAIVAATCTGNADGSITVSATGGTAPYQYSSNNGTSFQNSNILQVTSGTKTIVLKDDIGCTVSVNINVPLNNNLTVLAGTNQTICEGTSILLTGVATGTTNQWTPNFAIVNPNSLTPTVSPTTTTKYYLTTSTSVCSKIDSLIVTVRPAPIANAGVDSTICYGKTIQLNGTGGTIFQWLPNYNITNANTSIPSINPLINTTYWLNVEDIFGCKSLFADSVKISIIPPIVMNAGNDTIVAINQPLQLNATGSPLYLWTPSTWLNNANIANPVATIGITGIQQYYLKGFTSEGCIGLDTIKVTVFKGPDIYIPTAFTPNGDGVNDILRVTAVGLKQFNYYRIFNRWGQIVFETKDPNIGWKGFFNNKQQPTGTYIWMVDAISYLGAAIKSKGTVLLVR